MTENKYYNIAKKKNYFILTEVLQEKEPWKP